MLWRRLVRHRLAAACTCVAALLCGGCEEFLDTVDDAADAAASVKDAPTSSATKRPSEDPAAEPAAAGTPATGTGAEMTTPVSYRLTLPSHSKPKHNRHPICHI